MFNETKFSDKGNGFEFASSEGISDLTLMGIATEYRTNVSRKYRMLPSRLMEQTFTTGTPVFASVKYDGEGVFILFDVDKDICVAFNAPSGRARRGLPCLLAAAEKLKAAGVKRALFVGELYLKSTGERTQVSDVIRTTFNGTKEERSQLSLAVYDIIMLDGKDLRAHQSDFQKNIDTIEKMLLNDSKELCHAVEGKVLNGEEVPAFFKEVTEQRKLEGIVVRQLSSSDIYKIKPSISVDAVVIGFVEGDFEGQYGITSLLCALYDKDSKIIQALTRVGSGFTDEQRVNLLEPLTKLKATNPLDMTDSDGRPINFVTPSMVIEVSGESLVMESYHGKNNTSQTFKWDGKNYTFVGLGKFPLLTHATFDRFREDKVWDDGGCRMEQVISPATIADLTKPTAAAKGKPEVTLRETYVKEAKGEKMVRKILVVQTNSPLHFPYVVHWTNFSPGRKTPLETEVKVAETKERLEELVEVYRIEANKKGWVKA